MGRPAKAVKTKSGTISKADESIRAAAENALRGGCDKLAPPDYFSAAQRDIFDSILSELLASGVLCNLDIYVLTTCVIAIDRLQTIETRINFDASLIIDKDLMSAKDKYTKDLFRCMNELCLSPQARAKIGSLAVAKTKSETDPIAKMFRDGDSDEDN